MKIAQVSFLYYPSLGGVQTHVMKISESLARKGIDVEVLVTDPTRRLPEKDTVNKIPVRRFKSWAPMGDFYLSTELSSYLKKHFHDYDIVHAHSYNDLPAFHAAQAKATSIEVPFVFTPHYHGRGSSFFTNILHKFYKPFFGNRIYERADLVVCVSKYEKDLVEYNFPSCRGKTSIIPNGVDFGNMNSLQAFDFQKRQKIPSDYILYVGRIEPYKHVERIVAALKYVSERNLSLVLVGKGPSKGKIVKEAHKIGVEDRLIFFENLSDEDLGAIYSNARVLVNLSELEAYGLTVAEALARGTPCVVAKASALAEWVDDQNCLGIENTNDPVLVAKTIESVIGKRASGVRLLSWDDVAQRLLDAYRQKSKVT
jgi:glycosyltransferase involved in cell wall biosynthesis